MEAAGGTARAVLIAGAMIAFAIYFKPNPEPLRYIPLDKVHGVRFDAVTGDMELCFPKGNHLECRELGHGK